MTREAADELSAEEIARRRDDALRRALAMPPKPQEEMKLGKPRRGLRQEIANQDHDDLHKTGD